jgi:hypothetical protein
MKKIILLLTSVIFLSCDRQEAEWICNCQESQKVSEFVTANIKSANNMSDEEMEDVIKELRNTGIQTNCHQEILWQDNNSHVDWSKTKLDSCETYQYLY